MISCPIANGCVVCLLCVVVWGCGQIKPTPVATQPITPTSETPVAPQMTARSESAVKPVASDSNPSLLVATAPPGTAEAAFQNTLIAFQEGRLDAVFDNLPASYQADVEGLVREFAEKMDADVWSKTFATLAKIADILQSKKSLILSLDNIKKTSQFEAIKQHWDAVATGLSEVANSEVANINSLKKCDLRMLLGMASELLARKGLSLPQFGNVSVSTVESNAETTTLSYRETKDAEPKQVLFVKIEGKWLPQSIASNWSDEIAKAKGRLAAMPALIGSIKPLVLQQFEGLNGILDQVEQAKSPEQFQSAVMPFFVWLAIGQGLAEQAIRDAESGSRKQKAVHIVINRELTEDQQTKLKDAVLVGLNDSNVEYEIIPNDGKTRFRFTPVADSAAVVTVLQKFYEGATVTQESEPKVIRVELK